ncbi:MAG TPA: type VI secretion system-associated FHA domain protein TagH [Cellvibrio sp.]|nr:type VI secretion system-associated FHA domain protein TagH [Cellvibrio sp.]
MALQITLVKTPAKVSLSKTSQTFSKQGGTLGRGDANSWVLPDPDKFLSSCHCEILFDANSYYLLDLSTNGTFFNSSPEPLGKGSKSPLTDGDCFEIGEYRFAVKVIADQGFAGSSPFATPATGAQTNLDDIFAGGLSDSGSAFADPFSNQGFVPDDFSLGSGQSLDPLVVLGGKSKLGRSNDDFGGPLFDPVMGTIAPSGGSYMGGGTDHSPGIDQEIKWPDANRENLIPEDWGDDLLADPISSAPQSQPQAQPFATRPPINPGATANAGFDAGFGSAVPDYQGGFAGGQPLSPQQIPNPSTQATQTRETQTNIAPVAPVMGQPAYGHAHGQYQPAQQQPAYHQPQQPAHPSAFQAPEYPQQHQPLQPLQQQPMHHQPMQHQPLQPQPLHQAPEYPPQHQPLQQQPVHHQPIQQPVHHQPVQHQPVQHQPEYGAQAASNTRLIRAMGLEADRLSQQQIDDISDMVGELMRETVTGMMQILRSRTSIKNEFRMNVTTIQPVENNPLKFSVTVDDALENMFVKKTNAYKRPVDAFREGFQEVGEHQVAVIAGIRNGFERMMNRFDPDNLEQNFNKHGKGGSMIPGMQKAKYWNSYRDHYAGLVDNMESSFQHLFGGDFVNAYEDQLRKLAAARKKQK